MARASTVLSAIHVRLIHASVWLHRNRRDVGPSVAFERQRRIAAGGWQRPVFFSVEIVAGRIQNWNRAVPRYRRRVPRAKRGSAEVGGQESGVELRDQLDLLRLLQDKEVLLGAIDVASDRV